jgi:hypothetical protein
VEEFRHVDGHLRNQRATKRLAGVEDGRLDRILPILQRKDAYGFLLGINEPVEAPPWRS